MRGALRIGGGFDHQMVVAFGLVRIDPPAARHAKVEHHRDAAIQPDQPVFGAAGKRNYPRAGEHLHQIMREGAAQARAIDPGGRDARAFKMQGKAADGGLYFG